MRGYELLDAVGGIDVEYVEDAERPVERKRKSPIIGWLAAAACLCLLIGFAVPRLLGKGSIDGPPQEGEDSIVKDMINLEFNGAYYEVTDIPEVLERFGLPTVISEEIAGNRLSFLEEGDVGYQGTVVETDIELLEYAPASCRAVYVIRNGGKYYAALFCGLAVLDSDASTGFDTLYQIYGVQSAEDIASITEVDWNRDHAISPGVTGRNEISDFYNVSKSLISYGNDGFQARVFDHIPEDQQVETHTAFANDLRELQLETKDGLRFYVGVYPTFGWISGDVLLSYYQINGQMDAWIQQNLH